MISDRFSAICTLGRTESYITSPILTMRGREQGSKIKREELGNKKSIDSIILPSLDILEKPSFLRLLTAVFAGQKKISEPRSARTRLLSSGISLSKDRRPASTCAHRDLEFYRGKRPGEGEVGISKNKDPVRVFFIRISSKFPSIRPIMAPREALLIPRLLSGLGISSSLKNTSDMSASKCWPVWTITSMMREE